MGLQQNFAWQRAFNKILTGNGSSTTLCSRWRPIIRQIVFEGLFPGNVLLKARLQAKLCWRPVTRQSFVEVPLPSNILFKALCQAKLCWRCKESCILHTRDTPFRPILRVSCMLDSSYTTNGYTFLTSQRNIMSYLFIQ
jgi:hypothetical protein